MNTAPLRSTGRAVFIFTVLAVALFFNLLRAAVPRTVPELDLTLVPIAAGTFTMGSPGARQFDGPQTHVTLSKPFWLGRTEVTQKQWRTLMGAEVVEQVRQQLADDTLVRKSGQAPRQRDGNRANVGNPSELVFNVADDAPMYWVSWEEAVEFCRRLTERERAAGRLPAGYEYRLPTEAEWEYAARAGTTHATYAGDLEFTDASTAPVLDAIAWYAGNSSAGRGVGPRPVATKRPNAWGLYDMLGNVAEWVWDLSSDKLPGGRVRDPTGPRADDSTHIAASLAVSAAPGTVRVFRGGGWGSRPHIVFTAMRMGNVANLRERGLGFRVALAPRISR